MRCAQSKIDNEESVSRCKDRRKFIKEVITYRNAFVSGHAEEGGDVGVFDGRGGNTSHSGGIKEKQFIHSNTAPPDIAARTGSNNGGKVVGFNSSMNLLKILGDIDDHFLKASESAQEVSKMLEATRLHYHSNFADNRGTLDAFVKMIRYEGFYGFYKGMSTKIFQSVLAAAVLFMVKEEIASGVRWLLIKDAANAVRSKPS